MYSHSRNGIAVLAVLTFSAFAQEAQLDEVKVISSAIDDRFSSKRQEPSSVSVISGKKVDDAHAKDITQVLNSVPGVTAEVQSGDSVKIMLRGIENQRFMGEKPGVAIVIDGVPVFERTGRVNIDLDNIESIRVIKGGASYLFGEDALSGAVIITTKRGAKYAGVTVGAEAGSFDYYKRLARAGAAGEMGSFHLQYADRGSDDYYDQAQYASTYLAGNGQLYLTGTSDLTFGFEKSDRNKDSHGTVTGKTQAEIDPRSMGGGAAGRDYTRKYDVKLDKVNMTYSNDYSEKGNLLLTAYQYDDHTRYISAPQRYTLTSGVVTSADAYTNGNDYK
ncbi:partial Colicin I receptor, partial [Rhodocyclaceae bacterium]